MSHHTKFNKIKYGWFKEFLLSWIVPVITYDTETGDLYRSIGEVDYVITKKLFGKVYTIETGTVFVGTRTGRYSSAEQQIQSLPKKSFNKKVHPKQPIISRRRAHQIVNEYKKSYPGVKAFIKGEEE